MSGYTTKEVSELIGLQPYQIRHYVRRKLLNPSVGDRGEFRFSFQDVVILRSAKGLLDAQVPVRKAYRVLIKLQDRLERIKSLASVRVFADGERIVVRDRDLTWDAETGQGQLDFSVSE